MKKGINAWCFPSYFTLEQCFQLAKEKGYEGIELNMRERKEEDNAPGATLALTTGQKAADYNAIRILSERYALPVYSVSTNLHWTYALTDPDASIRERGMAIVREMIDAALALGANTVLVVPGLVTETVSYKTAYARAQSAFNSLKAYAEAKQIVIGVENVWNKMLLSPLEMRRFLEEINSSYVKAYFDAGNVLQFSYAHHWVEVLGDLIAKVHIKDFDTSIGNIQAFKPLLQGAMNWDMLISSLRQAGYDDYLTPELAPYNAAAEQLIEDTSRALDYILSL